MSSKKSETLLTEFTSQPHLIYRKIDIISKLFFQDHIFNDNNLILVS